LGAKYLISSGNRRSQTDRDHGRFVRRLRHAGRLAFTPDVYGAAVAIVAPSNLITLLTPSRRIGKAGRRMFHVRMGDPTTPEGEKQLERQSPLNSAARIKTPLMLVQGATIPESTSASGPDRDRPS